MSRKRRREIAPELISYTQKLMDMIEGCIQSYLSRKKTEQTLRVRFQIQPDITRSIWQQREKEIQKIFNLYKLKYLLNKQIQLLNEMLSDQIQTADQNKQPDFNTAPSLQAPEAPLLQPSLDAAAPNGNTQAMMSRLVENFLMSDSDDLPNCDEEALMSKVQEFEDLLRYNSHATPNGNAQSMKPAGLQAAETPLQPNLYAAPYGKAQVMIPGLQVAETPLPPNSHAASMRVPVPHVLNLQFDRLLQQPQLNVIQSDNLSAKVQALHGPHLQLGSNMAACNNHIVSFRPNQSMQQFMSPTDQRLAALQQSASRISLQQSELGLYIGGLNNHQQQQQQLQQQPPLQYVVGNNPQQQQQQQLQQQQPLQHVVGNNPQQQQQQQLQQQQPLQHVVGNYQQQQQQQQPLKQQLQLNGFRLNHRKRSKGSIMALNSTNNNNCNYNNCSNNNHIASFRLQ